MDRREVSALNVSERFKRVWNVFRSKEKDELPKPYEASPIVFNHPTRTRYPRFNDRTIVEAVYNKICVDVSQSTFKHVKLDEQGRYIEDIDSTLNECLSFQPNLDQTPGSFIRDIASTMLHVGVAAVVPVDTSVDPTTNERIEIYSLRVGEITQWYPKHVRVNLYNEEKGIKEEVIVEKRTTCIIENPFYDIMNEPNSTLQRLIRKLHLLDVVDEESSSGRLDIIIQLPYAIKSDSRRQQAIRRREDIEFQLKGSRYGVAYVDATEKITQLNRPTENNLFKQVEYLTTLLYDQLGLTPEIMNGTADEKTMLNYQSRTLEPILDSIKESMDTSFLGILGLRRKEAIKYFKDPFKLVPIGTLSEMSDKMTRNEILTSNEIRSIIGFKPSDDPKADELRNSNMPDVNEDSGDDQNGI